MHDALLYYFLCDESFWEGKSLVWASYRGTVVAKYERKQICQKRITVDYKHKVSSAYAVKQMTSRYKTHIIISLSCLFLPQWQIKHFLQVWTWLTNCQCSDEPHYYSGLYHAEFEVLRTLTTKNAVFREVRLRSPAEVHRHFGGTYSASCCFLQVAYFAHSSILKMEAVRSSETSAGLSHPRR
jgi:hypothetical protein